MFVSYSSVHTELNNFRCLKLVYKNIKNTNGAPPQYQVNALGLSYVI